MVTHFWARGQRMGRDYQHTYALRSQRQRREVGAGASAQPADHHDQGLGRCKAARDILQRLRKRKLVMARSLQAFGQQMPLKVVRHAQPVQLVGRTALPRRWCKPLFQRAERRRFFCVHDGLFRAQLPLASSPQIQGRHSGEFWKLYDMGSGSGASQAQIQQFEA